MTAAKEVGPWSEDSLTAVSETMTTHCGADGVRVIEGSLLGIKHGSSERERAGFTLIHGEVNI